MLRIQNIWSYLGDLEGSWSNTGYTTIIHQQKRQEKKKRKKDLKHNVLDFPFGWVKSGSTFWIFLSTQLFYFVDDVFVPY